MKGKITDFLYFLFALAMFLIAMALAILSAAAPILFSIWLWEQI